MTNPTASAASSTNEISLPMITKAEQNAIVEWFSGKSREAIVGYVFPKLAESAAAGCWQPGVSRKLSAALNKQNVAKSFAYQRDKETGTRDYNEKILKSLCDTPDRPYSAKVSGYHHWFGMAFGQFQRAPELIGTAETLRRLTKTEEQKAVLETAIRWAEAFAPIAKLIAILDGRRPKPVYVMKTISPTVLANVGSAMGIDFSTVGVPPMEWKWVTLVNPKTGKPYEKLFGRILWPEGTRHDTSRFAYGSRAGNDQCHACGHAIKNAGNWVPLVATTKKGPVSLWVGTDCARNLFGCEVSGEGLIEGAPGAEAALAPVAGGSQAGKPPTGTAEAATAATEQLFAKPGKPAEFVYYDTKPLDKEGQ